MSQVLLSVPPHLRDFLQSPAGKLAWAGRLDEIGGDGIFVGTDPRARRLGSGGGTVNLLHQAWISEGKRGRRGIFEWLAANQRLVLHAGGESRRLPAYAALGKAFLPMPAVDGLAPRRCDQMLADFQAPAYRQVLHEAGPRAAVLVTSGDVWLDFDPLSVPPASADITGIGMRVSPEVAQHFGVYFVRRDQGRLAGRGNPISFFLQKPSPAEIHRRSARYDFYVDTGMWLLSVEALRLLFRRCGWDERRQRFATPDGHPAYLDLYTEIGLSLGLENRPPALLRKLGWPHLKTEVIPLEDARFYHLGSSRQLFESFEQIQSSQFSPQRVLRAATSAGAFVSRSTLPVWLDGVCASPAIELGGHNVVTGVPEGSLLRRLGQGWCVEAAPVGAKEYVLRPYHLDDSLRGAPGAGGKICGQDARKWLAARGLNVAHFVKNGPSAPNARFLQIGLRSKRVLGPDVFDLAVYPVLSAAEITDELVSWFFAEAPDPAIGAGFGKRIRLSAAQIPEAVSFPRLFAERRAAQAAALQADFAACRTAADMRVFAQDFTAIAGFCRQAPGLRRWLRRHGRALLGRINRPEHAARLLLLLAELETGGARRALRAEAHRRLQSALIASNRLNPSEPRPALKDDQIVWARSPVRLDLAGGWTDTPPYCLEQGGAVLNAAVLLNGQPPIQVFVRPIHERLFRLRSIDLGSSEDVATFAALSTFRDPHSGFSLPKAALALAGFLPEFRAGKPARSLGAQLRAFRGGLEISLLSAVPKGSGLGTSSILAATLLGALNRACGLGWDSVDLYQRVLGMEQLLTTGGGWQDQAGALFRGVKLVQTEPGPAQTPNVRYLPAHLLGPAAANQSLLLYYTGVTRLAKGILQEIVADMFLGRGSTLRTLDLIRANAMHLHRAMQENDAAALNRCVARSWTLNKRLDSGVTTPEVERIIARCGSDLAACKLLGAGGGGYMLLCARDVAAGQRIRKRLEASPTNSRARFIDFAVAEQALEVTVS